MTRAPVRALPLSRWIAVLVGVAVAVALALTSVAAYREGVARDRIEAVLIDGAAAQDAWSGSSAALPGQR